METFVLGFAVVQRWTAVHLVSVGSFSTWYLVFWSLTQKSKSKIYSRFPLCFWFLCFRMFKFITDNAPVTKTLVIACSLFTILFGIQGRFNKRGWSYQVLFFLLWDFFGYCVLFRMHLSDLYLFFYYFRSARSKFYLCWFSWLWLNF